MYVRKYIISGDVDKAEEIRGYINGFIYSTRNSFEISKTGILSRSRVYPDGSIVDITIIHDKLSGADLEIIKVFGSSYEMEKKEKDISLGIKVFIPDCDGAEHTNRYLTPGTMVEDDCIMIYGIDPSAYSYNESTGSIDAFDEDIDLYFLLVVRYFDGVLQYAANANPVDLDGDDLWDFPEYWSEDMPGWLHIENGNTWVITGLPLDGYEGRLWLYATSQPGVIAAQYGTKITILDKKFCYRPEDDIKNKLNQIITLDLPFYLIEYSNLGPFDSVSNSDNSIPTHVSDKQDRLSSNKVSSVRYNLRPQYNHSSGKCEMEYQTFVDIPDDSRKYHNGMVSWDTSLDSDVDIKTNIIDEWITVTSSFGWQPVQVGLYSLIIVVVSNESCEKGTGDETDKDNYLDLVRINVPSMDGYGEYNMSGESIAAVFYLNNFAVVPSNYEFMKSYLSSSINAGAEDDSFVLQDPTYEYRRVKGIDYINNKVSLLQSYDPSLKEVVPFNISLESW